jgi:hypothetical protein
MGSDGAALEPVPAGNPRAATIWASRQRIIQQEFAPIAIDGGSVPRVIAMNPSVTHPTFSAPHQPEYDHTQWSALPWLVLLPMAIVLGIAYRTSPRPESAVAIVAGFALVAAVMFSFHSLRITDEGDSLLLRFGPLPLMHKRFRYADIAFAQRDRSSWIDGWGIHWVPRRGWTYNIWGRDCVRLTLRDGRTIRLGTDDAERLAKFVHGKTGA